jgi:hypothetical protein
MRMELGVLNATEERIRRSVVKRASGKKTPASVAAEKVTDVDSRGFHA